MVLWRKYNVDEAKCSNHPLMDELVCVFKGSQNPSSTQNSWCFKVLWSWVALVSSPEQMAPGHFSPHLHSSPARGSQGVLLDARNSWDAQPEVLCCVVVSRYSFLQQKVHIFLFYLFFIFLFCLGSLILSIKDIQLCVASVYEVSLCLINV